MTKWVILAGVVLTFATAAAGLWQAWLTRRKTNEIHVLVDGNLSKVMEALGISQDRAAQLTETLQGAGVDVPDAKEQGGPEEAL